MTCCCKRLTDLALVPMGGDGFDERVFATLEPVQAHGGELWWLDVWTCTRCAQAWMVAADQRIYDMYYLRRIGPAVRAEIEAGRWPDEFSTYEKVLRLGRTMSIPWTYLDPRSPDLVQTAHDLRRERPAIAIEEIAYLLGISVRGAERLLRPERWTDRLRSWLVR